MSGYRDAIDNSTEKLCNDTANTPKPTALITKITASWKITATVTSKDLRPVTTRDSKNEAFDATIPNDLKKRGVIAVNTDQPNDDANEQIRQYRNRNGRTNNTTTTTENNTQVSENTQTDDK